MQDLTIRIRKEGHIYIGTVEELPNIYETGDSFDETYIKVQQAIAQLNLL